MIRLEVEASVPGQPNDVIAFSSYVANALMDLQKRGVVVHRFSVEEDDA